MAAERSAISLPFYKTIQKLMVPQSVADRAKAFAEAVAHTTHYDDTRQCNKDKIIQDHFVSKIGEEAAFMVLSHYAPLSPPDYTIYQAKAKSWTPDLFVAGKGIAVKTQSRSSARHFGLSWTFRCAPQRRDRILDDPLSWVVLVAYDDTIPHTCFVYPPYQLKDLVLGEPKLERLKGFKKVVYATSLPIHRKKDT